MNYNECKCECILYPKGSGDNYYHYVVDADSNYSIDPIDIAKAIDQLETEARLREKRGEKHGKN